MCEDVANTDFGLAVQQKLRKLDILNERGDDDAQRRAVIADLDDMLSGPTYLAFTCRGKYREVFIFFPSSVNYRFLRSFPSQTAQKENIRYLREVEIAEIRIR